MPPPASLSHPEEDFTKTPPAVQALVLAQREEIWALREQIAVLSEQLSKNSKNSSRPPSSDPPSVEKPKRSPSGGLIDEVSIYDRTLSADEVEQNFKAEGLAVNAAGKLALTWGGIKLSR